MVAIAFLALWLGLALAAGLLLPRWWFKAIGVLLVLLIPAADHLSGLYYHTKLCEKKGGLKVYKTERGVRGIRDYDGLDERYLKDLGFEFVEARQLGVDSRLMRQGSSFIRERNVTPQAKYEVQFRHSRSSMFGYDRLSVEEISSHEVLGEYTQVIFFGGWAVRALSAFSDAGGPPTIAVCHLPPIWQHKMDLVKAVFVR